MPHSAFLLSEPVLKQIGVLTENLPLEPLSPRTSSLLKTLVEMHIREGQPVASKNLRGESGLSVSSATVRNIMSELEDRGFLASPHTSAGRVPTAQGYRFFVDSLLQVGPVSKVPSPRLMPGWIPTAVPESWCRRPQICWPRLLIKPAS